MGGLVGISYGQIVNCTFQGIVIGSTTVGGLVGLNQSGGRIVNSTSSSIKQELDNLILSNTFRMGVVGMSKTMAREFGPYNIMVNTMGPGRIYTDRIKYLNTIRAEKAGITLEEYNTRDAASFPQKRYQTADEYARSVVFICSPANSAISGQVICVDGAMTTAY